METYENTFDGNLKITEIIPEQIIPAKVKETFVSIEDLKSQKIEKQNALIALQEEIIRIDTLLAKNDELVARINHS